jgi:hypothetical protein
MLAAIEKEAHFFNEQLAVAGDEWEHPPAEMQLQTTEFFVLSFAVLALAMLPLAMFSPLTIALAAAITAIIVALFAITAEQFPGIGEVVAQVEQAPPIPGQFSLGNLTGGAAEASNSPESFWPLEVAIASVAPYSRTIRGSWGQA